jgi:thiol:disulfide interchange protein DsbC
MKKIIAERKDVAFYIKLFPLKSHVGAYEKAKAIACEKSLALLEMAYDKKPLPKATCETTIIDENIKLAERLKINSLPTLVLPDGRVISGYKDAEVLKTLIGK